MLPVPIVAAPPTPCEAPADEARVDPPPPERPRVRANSEDATPPGTRLTWVWLGTQLLPSPELAWGSEDVIFGLRWQVTPLLYSFGIDRRLSPWRAFVVEPLVRTTGSVEWFIAPEYLAIGDRLSRRFGFRTGLRAYFPIVERGDYLTVSVGSAYVHFPDRDAVSYQLGAYVLFGFFGMEQSVIPAFDEAQWIGTFNLRFF